MLDIISSSANCKNGLIDINEDFIIKNVIDDKNIFILKNVFEKEKLKSLRNKIFDWGNSIESSNPNPEFFFKKSFHRIDNDPETSKTGHIFHAYNITNYNNIQFRNEIESIILPMKILQERISGVSINTTPDANGIAVRPQFIHYPSGGGYFDWHEHPFLPQKAGLILSLSEKGINFFNLKGKWSLILPFY